MGVQIRQRQDADLPALAAALVRVHDLDGYPVEGVADPVAWLTPPRLLTAWTAVHDGQPVGHTALTRAVMEDDAARVWHEHTGESIHRLAIAVRLFVAPEARRIGAAGKLMRCMQEHGRMHAMALAFDVMLKDRAAIQLYEAAGCVRIGTIIHGSTEDEAGTPAAVYMAPGL